MKTLRLVLLIVIFFTLSGNMIFAQQAVDPGFDARVAKPAFSKEHPKVLFDEAHNNFHTSTGGYKPFADLMANDGYIITPNKVKIQKSTLAGYSILVIVNPLGAARQNLPGAADPAFTDEECDIIRDWVKAGGSLLLIADHAPFGSATERLADRFGINMSKGFTRDNVNFDPLTKNLSFLVFSEANKLLGDHAIINGRTSAEKIDNVGTFTGQSIKGPPASISLLKLSDSAEDVTRTPNNQANVVTTDKLPSGVQLPPGAKVSISTEGGRQGLPPGVSAKGRSQGTAFDFGKGRVVALGEAACLSAQLVSGVGAQVLGLTEFKMGMNVVQTDNRQFALNIMHWLSSLMGK